MKVASFAERLREAMRDHNWKQTELLALLRTPGEKRGVTFNKSDLSQYVNGHVTAGVEKMGVLADVLGVSSAWLSGEDVPKDPFDDLLYALDFTVSHEDNGVTVKCADIHPDASVTYSKSEWARLSARHEVTAILKDVEAAAKEKSPSSEEAGPSAEAREAAMLFDSAPEWLRQQVLGLLRAAESNRAARDDDPKDT